MNINTPCTPSKCCEPRLCENDYKYENICKPICDVSCIDNYPQPICDSNGRSEKSLFRQKSNEMKKADDIPEHPIKKFFKFLFFLLILVIILVISILGFLQKYNISIPSLRINQPNRIR